MRKLCECHKVNYNILALSSEWRSGMERPPFLRVSLTTINDIANEFAYSSLGTVPGTSQNFYFQTF